MIPLYHSMTMIWESMRDFYYIMIRYSSEKNLTWSNHGKHYIKVWSSELVATLWLGNIINAIYVHFWLPRIKKEILCNPIPEKYSLQWCSVRQSYRVFLSEQKCRKLNSDRCWRTFLLAGLKIFTSFEILEALWIRNWKLFFEKNCNKNMRNIGWP